MSIDHHAVDVIPARHLPDQYRDSFTEVPDWAEWAHDIVEKGIQSMDYRIYQKMARHYFHTGRGSSWAAKEHVTEKTVWRICRNLWGRVPDAISKDMLWDEDGYWDESAPEENRRLMLRIMKTLGQEFQGLADGYEFEYEHQMDQSAEMEVMIRVTRDSIKLVTAYPKGASFSK